MDSNLIQINGYKIKDTLGHGGMATVYLAIQESFDRNVAIKVMAEQLTTDPTFRDRFLQEAKIVSRLIHPNIVTVYDVGVINNHHFLSMEYIDGVDLKEKLHSISLFHLIKVIKEISLALDYAGRKGYVHRDIKPENIMINNEDGRAVLMDFGIAKAFDNISEMTQTGTAIGTPYYMSPEQAKGKEVDWRSDIYSLGVVFFQVLTGKLPYDGDSAVAVGIMHLTDPIPKLPDYMQPIFQPIIDKLMAKSPDDRYQNGEDIIKILNNISDNDLTLINTEFTKEGHRDSGENINYHVSTPISTSGSTSVRTHNSTVQSETEDETKIISIPLSSQPTKNTSKNNRKPLIFFVFIILILTIGLDLYFNRGQNSYAAKLFAFILPTEDNAKKENDKKLNALLQATQLIQQQLDTTKKLEKEKLLAKQKEEALKQAVLKKEKLLAEQQLTAAKKANLTVLLNKANTEEQQLTTNTDIIDKLYQTYQQIAQLAPKNSKLVLGFATIKATLLEMVNKQILNHEPNLATKTLDKAQRLFPELSKTQHVMSITARIATENKIVDLLSRANAQLSNNNLTGNDNNNALALFKKVLAISPQNKKANKGLMGISTRYFTKASNLIKNKQYQAAIKNINLGETVYPRAANKFSSLREKIQQQLRETQQLKKRQTKIKALLSNATVQLTANNIIPPSKNNALSQYQSVLSLESTNKLAKKGIDKIEHQLLSTILVRISAHQYTKAQKVINTTLKYFPKSTVAKSHQQKLNLAIKQYKESRKPHITNFIVKGQDFTAMIKQSSNKLTADRTIFIGFEYTNFGKKTTVLQAILYAGSKSDKLSTTPVIITKNAGVKYFKISRPVSGFAKGGYYIDFLLKSERVSTNKFSIED